MSRRFWGYFGLGVIIAATLVAVSKKQAIADWWELRGYTPPASVVSLANQDAMTTEGRRIFYVNHPKVIADAATFRTQCNFAEQTIVLGCYHPNQQGIDVYAVNDSRLNGVQQVTSAHEMLHAAYDRLSSSQKKTIDAELMDFYTNDLHDQRVLQTIDLYKQTEPNDVVNEMHSVFGSEVANLPQPLENYYNRYFSNRAVIAQFAAGYDQEFTSRLNQIKADDDQLATMRSQIDAEEKTLDGQLASLNAERARVERSNSESVIADYNARVDAYNAGVNRLKTDIATFNNLVEQRNSVAADLKGLQGALDTRLTTQPAQ